jgi:hypothetical protein
VPASDFDAEYRTKKGVLLANLMIVLPHSTRAVTAVVKAVAMSILGGDACASYTMLGCSKVAKLPDRKAGSGPCGICWSMTRTDYQETDAYRRMTLVACGGNDAEQLWGGTFCGPRSGKTKS